MKYQELYKIGQEKLQQADISEYALDARYLLEFVCHTDRNDLLVHGDREVSEAEEKAYTELLLKRSEHVPLQHLTGVQNFMGLDFHVNEKVLVPRQDTEILVEEAMRELHDGMRILDMCTGSGCILISLLHYSNDCEGVGADLSPEALEVAKTNARELIPDKKVTFIESNLFEKIEGKFDVILSNPPYIAKEVIPTLMPEVRDHEPRMALEAAENGLYFYRRILEDCKAHLFGGGSIYFEIGYDQGEAVSRMMEEAGFKEVRVVKDYAGLDRVVCGMLF